MRLISYEEASPTVRAVFDDIKATRDVPDVNNFWKRSPTTRRRSSALGEHQGGDGSRPGAFNEGADLSRSQRHQRLRILHRQPSSCCP